MPTMTLTHKGWFGICPVYLGNPYTDDAPLVDPRLRIFAPLMFISEALFILAFLVAAAINPEWEPGWPLRITGELDPHRTIDVPDNED